MSILFDSQSHSIQELLFTKTQVPKLHLRAYSNGIVMWIRERLLVRCNVTNGTHIHANTLLAMYRCGNVCMCVSVARRVCVFALVSSHRYYCFVYERVLWLVCDELECGVPLFTRIEIHKTKRWRKHSASARVNTKTIKFFSPIRIYSLSYLPTLNANRPALLQLNRFFLFFCHALRRCHSE